MPTKEFKEYSDQLSRDLLVPDVDEETDSYGSS